MRNMLLYLALFSLSLTNTGWASSQEKKGPPKEPTRDLALSARLQAAKQITDTTLRNRALQDVVVDLADAGASALVKQTLDALPAAAKQPLLVPCALRLAEAGDSVGALEMSKAISSRADRNKVLEAIARFGGNGQALLFDAARSGEANRVRKAIKRGADFNARNENGKTALHLAVEGGHGSVIAALLEAGASVTLKDGQGRTALDLAKSSSHKTLADLFGASDSDARLIEAVSEGKTILVKQLLEKGGNPNLKTGSGKPFLYLAAETGNTTLLKLLLDRDAGVHVFYSSETTTPLYAAVNNGHAGCVQILLEKGARPARGLDDLLHLAAAKGHDAVIKALVESEAKISSTSHPAHLSLLQLAVRNCQAATVKLLIEKGADVNAAAREGREEDSQSPLRVAIEKGSIEMVRLLLAAKARVKDEDTLHALEKNHLQIVTLLIDNGASPNASNATGTLLEGAVAKGDVPCIKALLAKKARVDERRGYRTPLTLAAAAGRIEVVKLLLEAGADRTLPDGGGQTAFDVARGPQQLRDLLIDDTIKLRQAAAAGRVEEIKQLLDAKVPLEPKLGTTQPALLAAASQGRLEAVRLLLERGADVHARFTDDATALRVAARRGALEIVRLLLAHGAAVAPTAVQEAKANGHEEIAQWLTDLLALGDAAEAGDIGKVAALQGKLRDLNVCEASWYTTPLMRAIQHDRIEVVKLLLEKGTNVNARNHSGETALFRAVAGKRDRLEVVKLLLEKGANVNARNRRGETALFWAIAGGRGDIVLLLLEKKANVNLATTPEKVTPLLTAIAGGKDALVPLLLAHKADVNLASLEKSTPLLVAISRDRPEVVKQLLAAKANVNAVDKSGTPGLILAVKKGNAQVVKMLLDAGANIAATDKEGHTALESASKTAILDLLKAAAHKEDR